MNGYDYIIRGFAILCLLFLFACPICSAIVASTKGRSEAAWFFVGLFFGPFGLIAAAGAPAVENYETRRARRGQSDEMKLCDYCVEPVRAEASVCRHCTSVLIEAAA